MPDLIKDAPVETTEERARVLAAAREIIASQTYCALVTQGLDGFPSIRSMNPFPPEQDMSVWMATNSRSRKIVEIRRDPRVCLYYANHREAIGSVVITGKAVLVDNPEEKLKRKRAYWDQAFPDWQYLMLIKVIPLRLEVINYKQNYNNAPVTWRAPFVEFGIT